MMMWHEQEDGASLAQRRKMVVTRTVLRHGRADVCVREAEHLGYVSSQVIKIYILNVK